MSEARVSPSSLKGGLLRNHLPFGRALRRFLCSSGPYALLPDCGWMDGGCLILADALVAWSEGALRLGASVRSREGRPFLDHAFAWATIAGTRLLIDGEGVQSESVLRARLVHIVGAAPEEIRYRDCAAHAVGIPRGEKRSAALSVLLRRRFGRFDVALLRASRR